MEITDSYIPREERLKLNKIEEECYILCKDLKMFLFDNRGFITDGAISVMWEKPITVRISTIYGLFKSTGIEYYRLKHEYMAVLSDITKQYRNYILDRASQEWGKQYYASKEITMVPCTGMVIVDDIHKPSEVSNENVIDLQHELEMFLVNNDEYLIIDDTVHVSYECDKLILTIKINTVFGEYSKCIEKYIPSQCGRGDANYLWIISTITSGYRRFILDKINERSLAENFNSMMQERSRMYDLLDKDKYYGTYMVLMMGIINTMINR